MPAQRETLEIPSSRRHHSELVVSGFCPQFAEAQRGRSLFDTGGLLDQRGNGIADQLLAGLIIGSDQLIEMLVGQWAIFQRGREGWRNLSVLLGYIPAEQPRTKLPQPKARLVADQVTVVPPGESQAALRMVSFDIHPGQAVGVIGTSGAGKSTLVKILLEQITPDSGRVRVGYGLEASYFDQQRETLKPEDTPWQVLCPDGGDTVERDGRNLHVKRYLQDFLFDEHKATQKVRTLSGGEQNRLLLARLFIEKHNMRYGQLKDTALDWLLKNYELLSSSDEVRDLKFFIH